MRKPLVVIWMLIIYIKTHGTYCNGIRLQIINQEVSYTEAEIWCRLNTKSSLVPYTDFRLINDTLDLNKTSFTWMGGDNFTQLSECENKTCSNRGQCVINNMLETCVCRDGYHGDHCEDTDCRKTGCKNQGTCTNSGSNYTCMCTDSYSGPLCSIPDCGNIKCENGGTCATTGQQIYCKCPEQFYGNHCEIKDVEGIGNLIGCYNDSIDRLKNAFDVSDNSTVDCLVSCDKRGNRYAAFVGHKQCLCTNNINGAVKVYASPCPLEDTNDSFIILTVYKLQGLSQNTLIQSCSFEPGDPCFLKFFTNSGKSWIRNDLQNSTGYAYVNVTKPYKMDEEGYAVIGSEFPSTAPVCMHYSYRADNNGSINLHIVDNDDYIPPYASKTLESTNGKWINDVTYQLKPSYFSIILFVGYPSPISGSEVRLGDVRLTKGYCDCPSSMCLSGMICSRNRSLNCCQIAKQCTEYKDEMPKFAKLTCKYSLVAPCFMQNVNNRWKRVKIIDTFTLLLKAETSYRYSGILKSIILPSDSTVCLTFEVFMNGSSTLNVMHTDNDETVEHLMNITQLDIRLNRTRVILEIKTRKMSKVLVHGEVGFTRTDAIYVTNFMLEENRCKVDTTDVASTAIYREDGTISEVTGNCQWLLQFPKGYHVNLFIEDFGTTSNCTRDYIQIFDASNQLIEKTCGGKISINSSKVKLMLHTQDTDSLMVNITWTREIKYCPALCSTENKDYLLSIPCHEKLDAFLCQRRSDSTVQATVPSDTGKTISQTLLTTLIAVSVSTVVMLTIGVIAFVKIRNRRRQNQTSTTGNDKEQPDSSNKPAEDVSKPKPVEEEEQYHHLALKVFSDTSAQSKQDVDNPYDISDSQMTSNSAENVYDHTGVPLGDHSGTIILSDDYTYSSMSTADGVYSHVVNNHVSRNQLHSENQYDITSS